MSGISVQGANIGAVPYSIDPAINGFLAWSSDIFEATTTATPTAATIYLSKIMVPKTITATNVNVLTLTAGTNYTNAQLGIYDSSGVLLGATAVQASAGTNGFGSVALSTIALTSAQTITGGPGVFVYGALHMGTNAATAAQFRAVSTTALVGNVGLSAAAYRTGTQTGHATNPLATIGTLTLASTTSAATPIWMAFS
jgi:hypothetical protein